MAEARVVARVDIKAPIEAAWREITKTGEVQRACFDAVLVSGLKPGSPYRYTTPNGRRTLFRGTVLEVVPPRLLAMTFRFPGSKEPPYRVAWELEPIPGGVRVTVVMEGVDPASKQAKDDAGGWRTFLANLRAVLEDGRPSLGTRIQYALMRVLLPLFPEPKE